MDAATIAAAALAIVVDESRKAAMRELLLERERLAMTVADRDSYLAQRHYIVSAQLPVASLALVTWQSAYVLRHNNFIDAQAAMRAALQAVRRGDDDAADNFLVAEVGSEQSLEDVEAGEAADEEMEEDEEEEEEAEEDAEVAPA